MSRALVLVVLAVAVLTSLPSENRSAVGASNTVVVPSPADEQTLSDACEATGTGNCVSSWVGRYIDAHGVSATAEYIMRARVPFEVNSCHSVMHDIGIYVVEHADEANIPLLIDDLPGVCTFGYQHGVALGVAKRFTTAKEYDRIAVTLCDAYKGDTTYYAPCVHGIGHGSINVHGSDVLEASIVCKSFASEADWCVGGAVMEWGATGGASRLQREGMSVATSVCADLVALINGAHTADECSQQIAPIAYNAFSERTTILSWCHERNTESARSRCGQGVGYTFDREKVLDVGHIKSECALVKDEAVLSGCLEAAALMLYPRWAVPDEKELLKLCDGYPAAVNERCMAGIDRGRSNFKNGPSLDGVVNPNVGSSL